MSRLLLAFFIVMLASCANFNNPPLTIKLSSQKKLNHRGVAHSLPVAIKLYQLEDKRLFNSLTFNELTTSDKNIKPLKTTLITLAPNEKQRLNWALDPKAQYLATVAFFRKPKGLKWRGIKPIPSEIFRRIYVLSIRLNNEEVNIQ